MFGKNSISFDAYYAGIFGSRWTSLKDALLAPSSQVAFSYSLLKPYYMDIASVAVASSMPELDDGLVLDMCAAPGGKTLVLASKLGKSSRLQANELSSARRARLHRVIEEHLCEEAKTRIDVTGYDGAKMAKFCKERYHRILVDAPCSSERHVISSPTAIKQWSPSRIKTLSIRQWALLSAAFLMLMSGGFLIYSTCALLEAENDCVIDKLLKKYANAQVVHLEECHPCSENVPFSASFSNLFCYSERHSELPTILPAKTRHGYAYLPDLHGGAGPMYFSLITKT